ncbi:MAG: DNA-binding protein [Oligoflexia bacterium]|nr:DNA-binding protein [Oligoflexia bacterium]
MTENKAVFHTLRLKPGDELKTEIQNFAIKHNLKAASIVSAVGSLREYSLRFANQKNLTKANGYFEIVSLSGALSGDSMHLHMAIADEKGKVIGGHLGDKNIIYTTCEVTLVEQTNKEFLRELDSQTGYKELVIKNK